MKITEEFNVPRLKYFLVAIFFIGVPNYFVVFDQTGIERLPFFNLYNALRVFLFLSVFIFIILFFLKYKLNTQYFKSLQLPLLFYACYLVLLPFHSDLLSFINPAYRIFEWLVFFFLLIFLQSYWKRSLNKKDFIHIIKSVFIVAFCYILIGLLFKFDLTYISMENGVYKRLGGVVIHPNTLAVLAGLYLSHIIYISKNKGKFFLGLFVFIILILTLSRGGLLGFFISLVFTYIMAYKINWGIKLIFLVFITVIIAMLLTFGESIITFLSRGGGQESLITLSERTLVWISSFEVISQSPFFGRGYIVGSKNFFSEYFQQMSVFHWAPLHCHNEFIQALVSGGIFMFLFSAYFFIMIFKKIKKIILPENEKKFFLSVFIQLSIITFLTPTLSWIFNIAGAFLWLLYLVINSEEEKNKYAVSS